MRDGEKIVLFNERLFLTDYDDTFVSGRVDYTAYDSAVYGDVDVNFSDGRRVVSLGLDCFDHDERVVLIDKLQAISAFFLTLSNKVKQLDEEITPLEKENGKYDVFKEVPKETPVS